MLSRLSRAEEIDSITLWVSQVQGLFERLRKNHEALKCYIDYLEVTRVTCKIQCLIKAAYEAKPLFCSEDCPAHIDLEGSVL